MRARVCAASASLARMSRAVDLSCDRRVTICFSVDRSWLRPPSRCASSSSNWRASARSSREKREQSSTNARGVTAASADRDPACDPRAASLAAAWARTSASQMESCVLPIADALVRALRSVLSTIARATCSSAEGGQSPNHCTTQREMSAGDAAARALKPSPSAGFIVKTTCSAVRARSTNARYTPASSSGTGCAPSSCIAWRVVATSAAISSPGENNPGTSPLVRSAFSRSRKLESSALASSNKKSVGVPLPPASSSMSRRSSSKLAAVYRRCALIRTRRSPHTCAASRESRARPLPGGPSSMRWPSGVRSVEHMFSRASMAASNMTTGLSMPSAAAKDAARASKCSSTSWAVGGRDSASVPRASTSSGITIGRWRADGVASAPKCLLAASSRMRSQRPRSSLETSLLRNIAVAACSHARTMPCPSGGPSERVTAPRTPRIQRESSRGEVT